MCGSIKRQKTLLPPLPAGELRVHGWFAGSVIWQTLMRHCLPSAGEESADDSSVQWGSR